MGNWDHLYQLCIDDPDLESLLLDGTYIRAYCCAAGAAAKNGQPAQQLGRSRGGFIIENHLLVDTLGYTLNFVPAAGNVVDIV